MLGWKASLGQLGPVPVQVSSTSQSPAAGRQTAPALPAGCWQASLEPSHSSTVHGFPSLVHAVPAGLFASEGQFGPVPVQFSAGSHTPADARHWVKAERNPSAGQVVPEPVQVSTSSQGPAAARHTAPALPPGCWQLSLLPSHSSRLQGFPSLVQAVPGGCFASAGQTVLDPVQVSARSHSPAVGRHVAPAFPAGCWHASLEPSQASVLHGLPSSVQLVPAALFASTGQLAADPVQFSAGSHSPADGRQVVVAGSNASAGHTVLLPVHVSSTSQGPADARQTAPALPAGCWQALLDPSH